MEDNNKDNIKVEIEDIYAKLITVIEERINSSVFENTDTGRIFFDVLKFYNIPNSEGLMSAMLFNLYENYQEVKNESYFDDFLNNLMTFYCELIKKYEEEKTELNKTLQATELDKKLDLDKITKKLSKKISEYDEVICYLQYELNRYEVYNDMSLTNINKKEKKQKNNLSAPERLQLLWDLGFDDLPIVKKFDDKQYKELMITILNYNPRDIEGYINSRKENSEESKYIITNKHIDKVKKYLDNL